MSRFYRIYRIHELLRNATKPVPMRKFMEELETRRSAETSDKLTRTQSIGTRTAEKLRTVHCQQLVHYLELPTYRSPMILLNGNGDVHG